MQAVMLIKRPERVNIRNKLINQHDNAKPHIANVVINYLQAQNGSPQKTRNSSAIT